MPRKHRNIILLIVGIILTALCWFWWQYSESIKRESREFYQKEYLQKAIKGKVKRLNFYGEEKEEVVISIDNGSEFDIVYGRTCVDKYFSDLVHEGDSVLKEKNSKTLRFFRPGGFYLETEINFCELTEE